MDWKQFVQLIAAFIVAAFGWWVVHYLSTRRDLTNERRKLRVSYLLEAYRKLESGSNRDDATPYWSNFESAIADIQLLGSAYQVSLARELAIEMGRNHTASPDKLIFDLRQSLRSELQLEPISENVLYIRIRNKP